MKADELSTYVVRDFVIYNVIFTSCGNTFTVKDLKNQLDKLKCNIDEKYLENKLLSFTDKGLIAQTLTGYAINN